jgi:hypothetical protein
LLRGEIRSMATARLPDGRSVTVAVRTAPVSALLDRDGRAEVLLIADPDAREGYVIGIRPAAGDRRPEGAADSPRGE